MAHRSLLSCRPALLLAGLSTALVAQSTTSAALTGVVREASGKPLAGALVRVSSPSMIGGERSIRTAANGSYRFPSLPPGRYRVTVEAAGFTTLTGEETLELGRTSTMNWNFKAAASTVVEVVATTDTVETASPATTVNFRSEDLDKLTVRRDLTSIANLTPGVNNGSAWGGDRTNSNAYLLDGINVGDPSTGEQWIQVNPDWFEEVQVGGLGAPAEYGGFSGGYFNAIVTEGGNGFKGDFTTYVQNQSWSAVKYIPDPDVTGQSLKVQANRNTDFAASLGGPILKDRLWFFVSAESITDESTPVGSQVSETRKTPRFLGNLTWQALPSATLGAFVDVDNVTTEHRGASRTRTPEATTRQESPNTTFGLSWVQTLTSTAVLTVRASGYTGRDDRKTYGGERNPLYVDGGVPKGTDYPGMAGLWEFNNAYQTQENKRSRLGLLATLDLFKAGLLGSGDQHAFKFGIEREHAKDVEKTRFPGGVSYNAFTDVDDLVYPDFVQVRGGLNLDTTLDRTALFVQDTWTLNDHVTLTPGLRYERFEGGGLWKNDTLAPRLGVTWVVDEAKNTAVKLHWGKYYDGLSAAYFDRAVAGAYPVETTYYWGGSDPLTPANLNNPTSVPYSTEDFRSTRSEASSLDPNVKQPYTVEWLASFDQKLGKRWTLGVSYVHRQGKDLLVRLDRLPLKSTATIVTNPLTRQDLSFRPPATVVAPDTLPHDYLITNSPDAKREYQAWTLSLTGNFTSAWDASFSCTRADLKGNLAKSNGYDSRFEWYALRYNAEGKLPGFNDDEIKVRTSYRTPWDMLLSANFTYLSGEHYTRTFQTARLSDRERYILYAEPLGSQSYGARRLLNLRVSQRWQLPGRVKLEVMGDVFNAFNSDTTLSQGTRIGSVTFGQPLSVEEPRAVRLGARLSF